MKRICVYAGSNPGVNPLFERSAQELGKELVARGLELVYGGSSMGLMGRVANAVLESDGKAIGVMPTGLFRGEIVHKGLTELHEVLTMHERKAKMIDLSDGFIALPGGLGTFEEIFEVVSWGQIGIHQKPIGLLNVDGYYTPLMQMVEHATEAGFIPAMQGELILCESDPAVLLDRMRDYTPPVKVNKWSELDK
ncbi:TIGR00730 family Rossman fold protein [Brevibacillus sp. M2.1A]|uniref:LOG family protein n=1 Tax=Brevibacillus TaxID=55080 RepID=UPI00156B9550|nr:MULTISPECIES: TIGR00730 family Rossman fold protein [Brevibacillus]MBY0087642.1 TIGR00730 family Rossman fold protein [Brevibacillus brevis]MCC8436692.1 TIGR00730 family Rossman fold protein [Brevibacillus sp. M2.1A]MCE0448682.1 TIGR00730 family Rossman fold protein [Brevibacillus sp. AF8]MCM3141177.1 TIGR00730 family Rossman fold protein [Brevibacillus sp. MER 51]UKK98873.1 TIGR00730 family Rossman fold protein [Brevibacillus brevis]